jgi:hypothetical protein
MRRLILAYIHKKIPALLKQGFNICLIAFYLVPVAGTTSPIIIKFLVGVLALDVTIMVLLNGDTTAAL